uniref:RING-type domain-containing protein n=1 Tax=Podarcis muralis TaxID=64176 RepID=A0A670HLQ7_PODMU
MATQSSTSLQDLIREDFLTCKICYDLYVVPKILPCLHTYCQKCLEPLVENGTIHCPECRLQSEAPGGSVGLKTNFFINSLLELFQMKRNKDLEEGSVPTSDHEEFVSKWQKTMAKKATSIGLSPPPNCITWVMYAPKRF